MKQKLIFTNVVGEAVDAEVAALGSPEVFVITDTNVAERVLPLLKNESEAVARATVIEVPAGETHKELGTLASIWQKLMVAGATRKSVAINVGGGVIGDMGGFAAAAFKRGMRCINVPTTLLSAVDASVGGKTAVNFGGMKNQIGVFAEPEAAIISTIYFNTLPGTEILSGYAEMLKHALLKDSETLHRLLNYSPVYPVFDSEALLPLLGESVEVKRRIVSEDLTEQGIRKALNLGHTAGHAFESLAMARQSPVPHGYAVAWGLVVELVLSRMQHEFPSEILHSFAKYVNTNYGVFEIGCKDYPALLAAMRQDKKNTTAEDINFTLLEAPGKPVIDCTVPDEDIKTALDIYRDLLGI